MLNLIQIAFFFCSILLFINDSFMFEREGCASKSMACRLGQAAVLNHITAGRRERTEKRKRDEEGRGGGGGEMKEQQMRDFPVRRINQQTMNSTAQRRTPRLDRSIATPSTHTNSSLHARFYNIKRQQGR